MGLKNLSARYLLICNLHITIIDDSEYFTVKIQIGRASCRERV